jgi:sugar phosphate isomerase/epimerase
MNNHWSAYLTLSIVHFMIFPETMKGEGPVLETVRRIADDPFFGGIEITWIKDAEVRKQVKSLLEVAGVGVAFGAQPTLLMQKLDLNSADPEMRARAVAQLKEDIDLAADMEINRLATLSGSDPGDAGRPAAIDRLADSLAQVCEYGKRRGVGITLETFDRTVDKKALIGPADESAAFSARMRQAYPDFGLMYDLSHQPLLEEPILPALLAVKDQLVHAHVGNCVKVPGRPGYGDQHPRFGFPGGENGVAELTAFLRGLFEVGYLKRTPDGSKPWVGIEVKPMPGETSDMVLANTQRAWIEAWARV